MIANVSQELKCQSSAVWRMNWRMIPLCSILQLPVEPRQKWIHNLSVLWASSPKVMNVNSVSVREGGHYSPVIEQKISPLQKAQPSRTEAGGHRNHTYLWEMNRLKSQASKSSQTMALESKSFPVMARCERADSVVTIPALRTIPTLSGTVFRRLNIGININKPHSPTLTADLLKRVWKSMHHLKSNLKSAQKWVTRSNLTANSRKSCVPHSTSFSACQPH